MQYCHTSYDGKALSLPPGKIVCVGRNYAAHARELNNPVPSAPLLFIKPATAFACARQPIVIPSDRGAVHHELEVALLLGETLRCASPASTLAAIAGVGLALDLTLRDLQQQLKDKSHPWEIAKAFDGACPITPFVAPAQLGAMQALDFSLHCNGQLRQQGNTGNMLFPVAELLATMSQHFTLLPGDVVLTGTPEGVGPLCHGDQLRLDLGPLAVTTQVVARPGCPNN